MTKPYVKAIENDLKSLQDVVGGLIQVIYPFDEEVGIVCNEEGLIDGLQLNRKVDLYGPIAGTFFVCGLTEDSFGSLSSEQIKTYYKLYEYPEKFRFHPINKELLSEKVYDLKQIKIKKEESKNYPTHEEEPEQYSTHKERQNENSSKSKGR